MSLFHLITNKHNQRTALLLFLWFILIFAAFLLRDILLPFVFAAILAYILNPTISRLCEFSFGKFSIPKGLAVLAVYLLIALLLYIFATLFLPEIYRELLRLGKVASDTLQQFNQTKIQELAATIDDFFHKYNLPIHIIAPYEHGTGNSIVQADRSISINLAQIIHNGINEFGEYIQAQSIDIVESLQNIIRRIINFIFKFFLVLMLAGFMLVDINRMKRFAFALSLTKNRNQFNAFLLKIDKGLSGVIRGQLLICLINSILTLIGLWILHIKFALLLATIAGIFSIIPIFGSIISTIPITLVAFLSSPLTALMALGWIIAIHALEANLLNPKIMGNSTKIHPVIIVLSLVAGEHYYGLVGALLAVPIASILLNIFYSLLYSKTSDLEQ